MIEGITGLHHVTMMASRAPANDRYYRETLGLHRVKKTVNFDQPDVYHLYWGDARGSAGTVMTAFPFGNIPRGRIGTGETSLVVFAVPHGSLDRWEVRLKAASAPVVARHRVHGSERLLVEGPDGEMIALEEAHDERAPYVADGLSAATAIRGFRSVTLRVADGDGLDRLLGLMGYERGAEEDGMRRYAMASDGPATRLDLEIIPNGPRAQPGAGSIHHIAFSVPDDGAHQRARKALISAGYDVTPVIDRDYFNAIYFCAPGGILFEIATETPGFATDEPVETLGQSLQLPKQHEHLRAHLERTLEPLD